MDFLATEIFGIISSWALIGRVFYDSLKKHHIQVIGSISEALFIGAIGFGIFSYLIRPSFTTNIAIIWLYAPHAYNLIIWSVFALTILRGRFGSRMLIPAFVFIYGLDEILWNSVALLRYYIPPFMFTTFWQYFFVGVVMMTIGGYLVVRPKLRFHPYIFFFAGYCAIYGWLFNMPTNTELWIGVFFEFAWQAVVLGLIYFVVTKRE